LGAESAISALRGAGEGILSEVLTTETAGERSAQPKRLSGAEADALMTLKALHSQLVNELLERDADLLDQGTLD